MARAAEEEENHWPGFVDALSTIVMVVTFLLIILGIAIFAISTQVSKAISQSKAEAAELEQVQAQMTASIDAKTQEAEAAAQKAAAAMDALQTAQAEAAEAHAEAEALSSQVVETSMESAAQDALDAAQETIAAQAEELQKAKQTSEELVRQIATLNQSAPKTPTQDETVEADNQLLIDSRKALDPADITVVAEEETDAQKSVTVQSAAEILTVHFEGGAVQLGTEGEAQALDFVKTNGAALSQRKISLWSFYDAESLSLTQAKRSAYFRVLALRNAMMDASLDTQNIDVSVRPANAPADVDTVKAFLQ